MGTQYDLPMGTLFLDDLRRLEAILTADHVRPAQGEWVAQIDGHRWEAASLDTLLAKVSEADQPVFELSFMLWLVAVHRDKSMESVGTVVVSLSPTGNTLYWQNDAELEGWNLDIQSNLYDVRRLLTTRPHDGKAVAYLRERRKTVWERAKAEFLDPAVLFKDVRSLAFGVVGGALSVAVGHWLG